jgi:hypothetical protein
MLPDLGRMWVQDFLVVDSPSYQSYAGPFHKEPSVPPLHREVFGDGGGFVRLIDTIVYPESSIENSPGYRGEVKVLSSLLLEEVYPLLATLAVRPPDLWPIARLHPREVYVGHTVDSQEVGFEWQRQEREIASHMISRFMEHLRKQKVALDEGK